MNGHGEASYRPPSNPTYLSAASANALISDLRPTVISSSALLHINLFLDELLFLLITSAESLNPTAIRSVGVPTVFTGEVGESTAIRALGRSAVGEAELELRSWIESNGQMGRDGFGRDGKGTGMKSGHGFKVNEAVDVMRSKCAEYSTLAGTDIPSGPLDEQRMRAWTNAGGSGAEETMAPAYLYLTAIIELVAEHVLTSLNSVVGRDSSNTGASIEDLYTAFAEDEAIWGIYKKMNVRISVEDAVRSAQKRATPGKPSVGTMNRGSPMVRRGSQSSLQSNSKEVMEHSPTSSKKTPHPPTSYTDRQSVDSSRFAPSVGSSFLKKSSLTAGFGTGGKSSRTSHDRSPSVLSNNTRNMLGAYHDQEEDEFGRTKQDNEDEFDALLRGGGTMKVSLTPSRLKTFDSSGKRSNPGSPNSPSFPRKHKSSGSKSGDVELPPAVPSKTTLVTTPNRLGNLTNRSRSSGQLTPKLQARPATTVTEEEENSEVLDEQPKESLKEIMDSEGRSPSLTGKRTAPAVVLASPPPGSSTPNTPNMINERFEHPSPKLPATTGSVNLPNRPRKLRSEAVEEDVFGSANKRTPAQDMADFFNDGSPGSGSQTPQPIPATPLSHSTVVGSTSKTPKAKTEARELADFFNSHPPSSLNQSPSKFGAPVENIPTTTKKGFKGFMAKIGSSKKDNKAISSDEYGIPTAGGSDWAGSKEYMQTTGRTKREQSLSSFTTAQSGISRQTSQPLGNNLATSTSATGIATAYREQQRMANEENLRQMSAQPSQTSSRPIPSAVNTTAAAYAPNVGPDVPVDSPRSAHSSTVASATVSRKTSRARKPVPKLPGDLDSNAADSSPEVQASPTMPTFALPDTTMRRGVSTTGSVDARIPQTVEEIPQHLEENRISHMSSTTAGSTRDSGVVDLTRSHLDLAEIQRLPTPPERSPPAIGPATANPIGQGQGDNVSAQNSMDQISFKTARENEHDGDDITEKNLIGVQSVKTNGIDSVPETSGHTEQPVMTMNTTLDSVPEVSNVQRSVRNSISGPPFNPIHSHEALLSATSVGNSISNMSTTPGTSIGSLPAQPPPVDTNLQQIRQLETIPASPRQVDQEPSVSIKELHSLVHLLDHATSARECQLLLAAVLAQWGLNSDEGEGKIPADESESRVTAWLLAGREGPIEGLPLKSYTVKGLRRISRDPTSDDEEVKTPVTSQMEKHPMASTAPISVEKGVGTDDNREEVLEGNKKSSNVVEDVIQKVEEKVDAVVKVLNLKDLGRRSEDMKRRSEV